MIYFKACDVIGAPCSHDIKERPIVIRRWNGEPRVVDRAFIVN
jgi:hypothetical protein